LEAHTNAHLLKSAKNHSGPTSLLWNSSAGAQAPWWLMNQHRASEHSPKFTAKAENW